MKITTKQIAQTAILLVLCIIFQCFKSLSVYITGPAVNAILIIATLMIGLFGGLCIALLSPIIAYFIGATPIMNMMPLIIVMIMGGNACIVLCVYFIKKYNLIISLLTGSVVKAAFLWLTVWYVLLPYFGKKVPDKMQTVVKTTFSLTQLFTALIGSAVAFIIYDRLKKAFPN